MSPHVGERGWSFVGHGFTPTWTPLTQPIAQAVKTIEEQAWERMMFDTYPSHRPRPGGEWYEYDVVLAGSRKRRRSRINGRFIVVDDQW